MQSGVENLARHLAPLYLSSPTYNPTKKPYLKLPRKMQLLYHNLAEGWEWGFATAIIYAKVAQIGPTLLCLKIPATASGTKSSIGFFEKSRRRTSVDDSTVRG